MANVNSPRDCSPTCQFLEDPQSRGRGEPRHMSGVCPSQSHQRDHAVSGFFSRISMLPSCCEFLSRNLREPLPRDQRLANLIGVATQLKLRPLFELSGPWWTCGESSLCPCGFNGSLQHRLQISLLGYGIARSFWAAR
jgi:hypothetical protein